MLYALQLISKEPLNAEKMNGAISSVRTVMKTVLNKGDRFIPILWEADQKDPKQGKFYMLIENDLLPRLKGNMVSIVYDFQKTLQNTNVFIENKIYDSDVLGKDDMLEFSSPADRTRLTSIELKLNKEISAASEALKPVHPNRNSAETPPTETDSETDDDDSSPTFK